MCHDCNKCRKHTFSASGLHMVFLIMYTNTVSLAFGKCGCLCCGKMSFSYSARITELGNFSFEMLFIEPSIRYFYKNQSTLVMIEVS